MKKIQKKIYLIITLLILAILTFTISYIGITNKIRENKNKQEIERSAEMRETFLCIYYKRGWTEVLQSVLLGSNENLPSSTLYYTHGH